MHRHRDAHRLRRRQRHRVQRLRAERRPHQAPSVRRSAGRSGRSGSSSTPQGFAARYATRHRRGRRVRLRARRLRRHPRLQRHVVADTAHGRCRLLRLEHGARFRVRAVGTGYMLDGWGALGTRSRSAAMASRPAPRSTLGRHRLGLLARLGHRAGRRDDAQRFGRLRARRLGWPAPVRTRERHRAARRSPRATGTAGTSPAAPLLPDGTGGYVLDGLGGLHPFAIGNHPAPPASAGYWNGWDIAVVSRSCPTAPAATSSTASAACTPSRSATTRSRPPQARATGTAGTSPAARRSSPSPRTCVSSHRQGG